MEQLKSLVIEYLKDAGILDSYNLKIDYYRKFIDVYLSENAINYLIKDIVKTKYNQYLIVSKYHYYDGYAIIFSYH